MNIKILLTCLAIALVTAACGKTKNEAPFLEEVSVSKVEKGTIEQKVLFTGNIVAKNTIDIYPKATGKISKKLLHEGDPVKRNQAILMVNRDEVGYTFKPMPIRSPIEGLVGKINVDVGTNITTTTPVATVVQPGDVRVKLDVPERYLNIIKPDTDVSMIVDSLGGETFNGKIITSSPFVDQKTRTANIEILLPNSEGKLRHGMFARMYLVVNSRDNTLMIPNEAISWEGDKQFVYKVQDEKVFRIQVKLGIRNDTHVEVLEGVAEGDLLVVSSHLTLADGKTVKIKNETN